jgi:hypothetical protein
MIEAHEILQKEEIERPIQLFMLGTLPVQEAKNL